MKILTMLRFTAIIAGVVAFLMVPAFISAVIFGETEMYSAFLIPMSAGMLFSFITLFFVRNKNVNLRAKDGYIFVFFTWVLATFMGSICYYLAPNHMGFVDAIFESACSFSTTGATVVANVEDLAKSLLFWRSISQWAGGMGIILLFVALFPILGVGSFQLIKAEVPGPDKERVRPRINETAKTLWAVYCIFTAVLVLLYRIGGMEWFAAICQGMSIMTTGGVTVHNEGFAYYNSAFIDWVTVIFMILAAVNFNIYYRIARGKYKDVLINTELRAFLLIFIVAALFVSISIISNYDSFAEALRIGTFQAASFISTTGTVRADYALWSPFAQAVLFLLMFIGGCSGSTAGGIKVIRHVVLFKQAGNEIRRMLYPRGVFSIQINKKVGRKDIVYGVAGFVFIYFVIVAISTLLTTSSGLDMFSSFSISLSMLGNIGAGFSANGALNTYADFPDYLKLFYSLLMITGRLELWAVVAFFSPSFWRS